MITDSNVAVCENVVTEDSSSETATCDQDIIKENAVQSKGKDKKYELSAVFKEQLGHLPEILEFIYKLQRCIEKQRKKLKKFKYKEKVKTKSVSTQTNGDTKDSPVLIKSESKLKTLTEEITEAADQALQHNGFVYEETSGLYYDYNSGYYYNAEYGLYYDGNTGTYMKYNQETKEYEFHSQTPQPSKTQDEISHIDKHQKVAKHKNRKEKLKRDKLDANEDECNKKKFKIDEVLELEDGECSDRSETSTSCTDDSCTDMDFAKQWPPCMRIIVEETSIPAIKQGSLFVVTFDGGTIGREGTHAILLPEINTSKHHGKISFDSSNGNYFLTDVGSRNGTFLNGKRLAPAKVESEPHEVVHGSRIQIGSTVLLCHVHTGSQTCGHCEPGLFQTKEPPASVEDGSKVIKVNDHKRQLKQLRKKFGLSQNDQGKTELGAGYTDRALNRRVTVGSQNPHEKTQVASLNESIAPDNKGFKLLSKMGWKEGQALGKDSQGRLEPVELSSNPGTSGMGSTNATTIVQPSIDNSSAAKQLKKQNAWMKAQERYNQVGDDTNTAFDLNDL